MENINIYVQKTRKGVEMRFIEVEGVLINVDDILMVKGPTSLGNDGCEYRIVVYFRNKQGEQGFRFNTQEFAQKAYERIVRNLVEKE